MSASGFIRLIKSGLFAGGLAVLSACGGGGAAGTALATFTIGGTVTGLTGSVVLQNNGGDNLTRTADGDFTFGAALTSGTTYNITVLTQPVAQTCSINNGIGTATANVNNVSVQCTDIPWAGTKQLGVAGYVTWGNSVATDADGNVYVGGETTGGLDGNARTGTQDFFITKYDRSGVKQYTKQLGVAGSVTSGNSVATDASGNIYVAGWTNGNLDGNARTGIIDIFVTKYDSKGVRKYTRLLGVTGAQIFGSSVTTDAGGNVYVAGYTGVGLDGNTLIGTCDFFLTKFDSSGVKQYTRQLGVVGAQTWGTSVATDASGNVYVAGETTGGLDGNTLMGTSDFFVTKYDSSGVKQYTRQLGAGGVNTCSNSCSVAIDSVGNVYIAGVTYGGLDGNTLMGTSDLFITKYNSIGVKQYTKQLGVTGAITWGNSVAADTSGNVYVAGYTDGDLNGNTLKGTRDFFVAKYDSNGVKQLTRQFGVVGAYTYGNSVATDVRGNVYVAGNTYGGLDGNPLMGIGDFFVTKFNSAGVKQ
jgi:hypothetical protein